MARIGDSGTPELSPAQAQYVIERLVSERRVAPGEIAGYLAELPRELAQIETRLRELRGISGSAAEREPAASAERPGNGRTRAARTRGTKRRGNPLAGRYMGYMRQVPEAKKPKYRQLKEEKGYEAAITALRTDLGK